MIFFLLNLKEESTESKLRHIIIIIECRQQKQCSYRRCDEHVLVKIKIIDSFLIFPCLQAKETMVWAFYYKNLCVKQEQLPKQFTNMTLVILVLSSCELQTRHSGLIFNFNDLRKNIVLLLPLPGRNLAIRPPIVSTFLNFLFVFFFLVQYRKFLSHLSYLIVLEMENCKTQKVLKRHPPHPPPSPKPDRTQLALSWWAAPSASSCQSA